MKFGKCFILVMFLIGLPIVLSSNIVNLRESWESSSEDYWLFSDARLVDISKNNFTSYYIMGDIGRWYMGNIHGSINDEAKIIDMDGDKAFASTPPTDITLVYFPEDYLSIIANSQIEITYNFTRNSPSDYHNIFITFHYINGSCIGISNDNTNSYIRTNYCQENFLIKENNTVMNKSEKTKIVLPLYWFENDTYIDQIIINVASALGTNNYNYIYDINFTNFLNSSNDLPFGNFSITQPLVCIPEGMESIYLNLSINMTDYENDTIYYSVQDVYNKNYNESVKYTSKYILIGERPNYNFVDYVYNDGSHCNIETKTSGVPDFVPIINITKHNLVDFLDDDDDYLLALSSTCTGDQEYIYSLGKSIYNLFYYTEIYGLQTSGENFNLTFYDSLLNRVNMINFIVQYNDTVIRDWNGTGFNEIGNFTTPDYFSPLYFSVNVYSNQTQDYLLSFNDAGFYNITKLQNDSKYKYIGIDVSGGVIYQHDFIYSGIAPKFNWSSEKPIDVLVNEFPNGQIILYVSDSIHYLDDNYNKYEDFYTVTESDYCNEIIDSSTLQTTGSIIYTTCGALNSMIGSFNTQMDFCLVFKFIFQLVALGVSIGLTFIFARIMPSLAIGVFFVLYSIINLFGNQIFNFSTTIMLIFGVMFGLGIGAFFLGFFLSGSSGVSE